MHGSQLRRAPGIPLTDDTVDDINGEFLTPKSSAPDCTIGCVHRVSTMDYWRKPQPGGAYIHTGHWAQAAS